MAHYAFLTNNIVTEVIVGKEEGEDGIDWEQRYSEIRGQTCKRTSFNTHGGVHKYGGVSFRKNYAGVGFSYNPIRDAFIPPKPFDSWVLDEETCLWQAPVPFPTDGAEKDYSWDEIIKSWVEITK
jgi:hypothetical protein